MKNKIKLIGELQDRDIVCEASAEESSTEDLVALYIKFLHLCGYDIPQDILQSISEFEQTKK